MAQSSSAVVGLSVCCHLVLSHTAHCMHLDVHPSLSLLYPHHLTFTTSHYYFTLTTSPSLPHTHYLTLTTSPSLLHPHYLTLTTSPSLLHPHYLTLTTSPSLPHPHCLTLTTSPSPHSPISSIQITAASMLSLKGTPLMKTTLQGYDSHLHDKMSACSS